MMRVRAIPGLAALLALVACNQNDGRDSETPLDAGAVTPAPYTSDILSEPSDETSEVTTPMRGDVPEPVPDEYTVETAD